MENWINCMPILSSIRKDQLKVSEKIEEKNRRAEFKKTASAN
jgi:hypothetical protein